MSERRVHRLVQDGVPTLFESPLFERGALADVPPGPDGQERRRLLALGIPYEGVTVIDRHSIAFGGMRPPVVDETYARWGADEAPVAIRRQSVQYSLDQEGAAAAELGGRVLADWVDVRDAGDVALEEAADFVAAVAGDHVLLTIGGDHLIPLPVLRGLHRAAPERRTALVVFDSHLDMHESPPLWAGSQWRTAFAEGLVRPEDAIVVGVRGIRHAIEEWQAARELGVRIVTADELDEPHLVRDAIEAVVSRAERVYVSFDVDSLDPSECPAQKYPSPGGLRMREVLPLIRAAAATRPLCGLDVVCLSPRYDMGGYGALCGARLLMEGVYAAAREAIGAG